MADKIVGKPTILQDTGGTANVFPVTTASIVLRKDGIRNIEESIAKKTSYEEVSDLSLGEFNSSVVQTVVDLKAETVAARKGKTTLKVKMDEVDLALEVKTGTGDPNGKIQPGVVGQRYVNEKNELWFAYNATINGWSRLDNEKFLVVNGESSRIDLNKNPGTSIKYFISDRSMVTNAPPFLTSGSIVEFKMVTPVYGEIIIFSTYSSEPITLSSIGFRKIINNVLGPWTTVHTNLSGASNTRPTAPPVGYQFFDTTLGKPIWFKTSGVWVDAMGTTV